MSERIVESLVKVMDRRRFLRDLGVAAVGSAMMLLGLTQKASAITCKCCSFPQINYCSTNPCVPCPCHYSWNCLHSDGKVYVCHDCGCPPNCAYYRLGPSRLSQSVA